MDSSWAIYQLLVSHYFNLISSLEYKDACLVGDG